MMRSDEDRVKTEIYPETAYLESPTDYATTIEKPIGNHHAQILIIEDNPDVRNYLTSLLQSEYIIYQAANGNEGLKLARSHAPDLVISDVMMPEMDGFELCRLVKSEIEISHIPVILLTARVYSGRETYRIGCRCRRLHHKAF